MRFKKGAFGLPRIWPKLWFSITNTHTWWRRCTRASAVAGALSDHIVAAPTRRAAATLRARRITPPLQPNLRNA